MNRDERGMTLVEILIVLGIAFFGLLFGLAISVPRLQSARLDSTMEDMTSVIFVAQQNAYAGRNSTSYGIYFNTESYVLFTGDSYATATSTEDISFPAGTSISQVSLDDASSEIVFVKGSVVPSTFGTVSVTNERDTYVIDINSEGLIDWYVP